MTASHPSFVQPDDLDIPVWRYMNLSRFIWVLQNRALYFCRADKLGDPYEGYHTEATLAAQDSLIVELALQLEDKVPIKGDAWSAYQWARQTFEENVRSSRIWRQEFYISCWHANDEESSAMWRLYTSFHESVCIRSTYSTLARLLPDQCYLGKVRYLDYRKEYIDFTNGFDVMVSKRRSFAHEREVRAVIWDRPAAKLPFPRPSEFGMVVEIDTAALIETVYVSPDAEPGFRDIVEKLTQVYGLNTPVLQSGVNAPPPY